MLCGALIRVQNLQVLLVYKQIPLTLNKTCKFCALMKAHCQNVCLLLTTLKLLHVAQSRDVLNFISENKSSLVCQDVFLLCCYNNLELNEIVTGFLQAKNVYGLIKDKSTFFSSKSGNWKCKLSINKTWTLTSIWLVEYCESQDLCTFSFTIGKETSSKACGRNGNTTECRYWLWLAAKGNNYRVWYAFTLLTFILYIVMFQNSPLHPILQ